MKICINGQGHMTMMVTMAINSNVGQVSLTATVTCNQYYLLSCGADGAR